MAATSSGFLAAIPELLMEILRHEAEVEVVEPEGLWGQVTEALEAALRRYRAGGGKAS